ncbi:hypothetical protein HK102_001904 [Quaeritorhiza haematococci]|nr:hypothetical protein HK102_001904 [Quaeritorhiza haematococci]
MWPSKEIIRSAGTLASLFSGSQDQTPRGIGSSNPFEIRVPIQRPDTKVCVVELAQHEFGFSFGAPFVGNFTAPTECGSDWSRVILDFESSVKGRQFDRYGAVWLGGAEVMRFTSAEPNANGITWHVEKDITTFKSHLARDGLQSVVIALDNLVNDVYTGIFNVTLKATFYAKEGGQGGEGGAQRNEQNGLDTWRYGISDSYLGGGVTTDIPDKIVPLSASSNSYGWFSIPQPAGAALSLDVGTLPRNIYRAKVEVFISGHSCDEFWYTNPPTSYATENNLCPGGAAKEIQMFVDDKLAGVDVPFVSIYTGGFNPLLWRPISAIGSFDVPSAIFDITPLAAELSNGKNHTVTLKVAPVTNSFWLVSANLLLWTDSTTDQIVGNLTEYTFPVEVDPAVDSSVNQTSKDADFKTEMSKTTVMTGYVIGPDGRRVTTTVKKRYGYLNEQKFRNDTNWGSFSSRSYVHDEVLVHEEGAPKSAVPQGGHHGNRARSFSRTLEQIVTGYSDFQRLSDGNFTINAAIDELLSISIQGDALATDGSLNLESSSAATAPPRVIFPLGDNGDVPAVPGRFSANLTTKQSGSGNFSSKGGGYAQTTQTFRFKDTSRCYRRDVKASNRSLTFDEEQSSCEA